MVIIQGVNDNALPRLAVSSLVERLRVMPAVVVTGARQTGKTTLVRELIPGPRRFCSLDDWDVRDLARRRPDELLEGEGPVTIDEVQKEPRIMDAVKRVVDAGHRPGRFLLTGSANLLLMKQIAESLAGRASYLTLRPMTHREQQGLGQGGMWEELLATGREQWTELLKARSAEPRDWRRLARRGGFPRPALQLETAEQRNIWFDGYVRTYLERDLSDLSSITALPDFRRLMRIACLRVGRLVNQTELGRDAALSQPTVHRYLNLLETSYILARVPAYAVNRTKRLMKSPKLYWGDVGLAMHLTGETQPRGAHLENIVLNNLLAWRDARMGRADIFHWRTAAGEEVDFVIESGDDLLPVEVKSSARPRLRDGNHLRTFRSEYGERVRAGLVLHAGREVKWLTANVLAAPWWKIL